MKWSIFDKGNEHFLDSLNMDPDAIKSLKERWITSNAEIFEKLKIEKHDLPQGLVITHGALKKRSIINSDLMWQKLQMIESNLTPNQYVAVAITDKFSEGNGRIKVAVSYKGKRSSHMRLSYHQVITNLVVEHDQLLIVEKARKGATRRPWEEKNKIQGGLLMVINNDDRAIEVISTTLGEDEVLL